MDRLEKIKGYADRLPADDAKWLVAELGATRASLEDALTEAADQRSRAIRAERELAELRAPVKRCPCGHPDDHAGWCPRR